MIVRIMADGQYELTAAELDDLNELDNQIEATVRDGDQAEFGAALERLHARVREIGSRVADESLLPSDVVLPPADATLEEVRELFDAEGLIPG